MSISRHTLRDLLSGRYVIQARAPKHGEVTAQAVVVAGRTTDVGAVRLRSGEDLKAIPVGEFLSMVQALVRSKSTELR